MKPDYVGENAVERRRLFRITANLSEEDLARLLPDGWSVAAAFVHLAFWDRYYLSLVGRWERTGFAAVPVDADAVNDAVLALSLAMPPKGVIQLVCDAAEAIDRKVEDLTPELASAIDRGGHTRILFRAKHRREHLDEIERAVGTASRPNVPSTG